ncbi:alkene reductase [Chitinophaga arvensicola]|uniref:N-ethylmaleimide reductase n=1 Tax=Chitinophaga arvensicola TaxID=29529 RepID=A0A1I0S9H2_9BACT|nr:alkene reductase [Chitinophaga arvensicola]SEW52816.1 N-ethylmaleimide reductase [Chitinophaga arvensicola]
MSQKKLVTPFTSENISLSNRVVMAPMNRRKAIEGVPPASMITYYQQRAGAGLLITDNIAISSNGGAYMNTPGIYTEAQKQGWKKVVDGVHAKGGKIFAQLVQAGRVGHPAIQHNEPLIAPSAIQVNETIRTPDNTYQPMTMPIPLNTAEIPVWVAAFRQAAANAMEAGFDGVEIHAAHGFLIDQFINPHSNHRTDEYGGSIENRTRFLLEVMKEVVAEVGKNKVGIRLSPFREIYDLKPYPEELSTHEYILEALQALDILYIHFSNAVTNEQPSIPTDFLQNARQRFKNIIIIAGGFTVESAEEILQRQYVNLVAFGKLYISNPDLVERIKNDIPLADWDETTFYHGGDKGYIDYPAIALDNCVPQ